MIRLLVLIMVLAVSPTFSYSQPSLPSNFQSKTISSPEGAEIFVRWSGKGPVVVLMLEGGEQRLLGSLAADLVKDHTVVVPDLRGIGSSQTAGGYDKKTQGEGHAGGCDRLRV